MMCDEHILGQQALLPLVLFVPMRGLMWLYGLGSQMCLTNLPGPSCAAMSLQTMKGWGGPSTHCLTIVGGEDI